MKVQIFFKVPTMSNNVKKKFDPKTMFTVQNFTIYMLTKMFLCVYICFKSCFMLFLACFSVSIS